MNKDKKFLQKKKKKKENSYYESKIVHRRNSNDLQLLESINLQRFIICWWLRFSSIKIVCIFNVYVQILSI
jgi:hypothetical protein